MRISSHINLLCITLVQEPRLIFHTSLEGFCAFTHITPRLFLICGDTLLLLAFADPRTIRTPLSGVTIISGIIDADSAIGTLNPRNSTAGLRFSLLALSLVFNGYARSCRSARVSIRLAVATAYGSVLPGANRRPGLACALRIRHLASTGTKIAVLLCVRTGFSSYSATSQWLPPRARSDRLALRS